VIGWGVLGAVALREFSLALLVGMISGVFSSIFIATPLMAWLKRDSSRKSYRGRLLGDDLRGQVMGAGVTGRVLGDEKLDDGHPPRSGDDDDVDDEMPVLVASTISQPADRLLSHPPRPRKKKRR
jgi:preprotein translocase subunit SecF